MYFKILWSQAKQKWQVTLLLFLAMTALVTLYVYLQNTSQFSSRSMALAMKAMGHNMILLPKEADPLAVYLCTDGQDPFSEESTCALATHPDLSSKYYVSVLQKRLTLSGLDIVLTGIEPVLRGDETAEKSHPIPSVPSNHARLGFAVGKGLKLDEGDQISILGEPFAVAEILPERGDLEDYRVYVSLKDCQRMLGLEGKIHVIWAFMCLGHGGTIQELEARQRKLLEEYTPALRHISKMDIATGRYTARLTTEKSLFYLLALVFSVTVLVIVVTGLQEVTERRRELGIFIALGATTGYVVLLYLGKMLIIAVAAALAGFYAGSELAVGFTSQFLVSNTQPVSILYERLPVVLLLTCAAALGAMLPPIIQLVRTDPNQTLNAE